MFVLYGVLLRSAALRCGIATAPTFANASITSWVGFLSWSQLKIEVTIALTTFSVGARSAISHSLLSLGTSTRLPFLMSSL